MIGIRRPIPHALVETLIPRGSWRRELLEVKQDSQTVFDLQERRAVHGAPAFSKSLPGYRTDILALDIAHFLHASLGRLDLNVERDALGFAGQRKGYHQFRWPCVECIHRDHESWAVSTLLVPQDWA